MKLTKLKKIIGGTVSAMMIAASIPTVASAADQQTRGNIGGYDYEMWNQNGQGQVSMNPGAGSFTCSWSNIENFLARMGKNYDSQKKNYKAFGNIVLTYDVEYTPRGNSYMCVYGWTRNPLMEYYIVEGWGDWRPPGNDGENKGTVTLNGNTYDIRKTMRYNQPSLDGTATFPQYWSVRKTSGSANNQTNYMKGTIDVSKHFDAWAQSGLDMSGTLYEVSLNIEGYRSNGSANVKSVTVSQGGSDSGQQQNNNNNQQNNNNNQNQGWDWNNQGNQNQGWDWNNQGNQNQGWDWNNQGNQNQGWDWNNQGNQNQGWDWNNQGNQNQGWDWNNQNQNNQWDWNNQWNNNNNNQWNGANNWDWNNQNNWNNQGNQNNGQQQGNTQNLSGKKLVAISFDDGASAQSRQDPAYRIMDALIKNNMTATFFYVSDWIKTNEQVKFAYQNGMEVANHTKSHQSLGSLGSQQIRSEWEQCNSKLKSIIGTEPSHLMRLPYLDGGGQVKSALYDVPLISCGLDTQDWNGASKDQIVNTIKQAAQNGSLEGKIVLCHENYATTAAAMEEVLPWLAQNGYQNVTVSEMFAARGKSLQGGQIYTQA